MSWPEAIFGSVCIICGSAFLVFLIKRGMP